MAISRMDALRVRRGRVFALLLLGLLTACQSGAAAPPSPVQAGQQAARLAENANTGAEANRNSAEALAQTYLLGPGDRLRVIVFQEPDLSGEFEVNSAGQVALPLIEPITAQGLTVHQFQEAVSTRLRSGYLVNPRVSAEVLNYRPFYITGEVNRPGEYPYVAGMNILKAIAMAGGYTYRANTGRVFLTRVNSGEELVIVPSADALIMPGDFIRISERFF